MFIWRVTEKIPPTDKSRFPLVENLGEEQKPGRTQKFNNVVSAVYVMGKQTNKQTGIQIVSVLDTSLDWDKKNELFS